MPLPATPQPPPLRASADKCSAVLALALAPVLNETSEIGRFFIVVERFLSNQDGLIESTICARALIAPALAFAFAPLHYFR